MLSKKVDALPGIGPKKTALLKSELGISTIEDILYYAPRRYLDRSAFKQIKDSFVNDIVTLGGIIKSVKLLGRNKKFLDVVIDDGTGTLSGIFFGAAAYYKNVFKTGDFVLFSGKVEFYKKKQIIHPDFDFLDEDSRIKSINTGRVIPLYRSSEKLKKTGLESRGFRRIIRKAIDDYIDYIVEPFESSFLDRLGLMGLKDSIINIHFPETLKIAELARRRLSFNELFFLQYYLAISKNHLREIHKNNSLQNKINNHALYQKFTRNLKFTLTGGQLKSIEEIKKDIYSPYPMNRLLQGDVGSGKTVVSVAASIFAFEKGKQTAVMAPTEVLANQHFETFKKLLPEGIKARLITSSTNSSEKKEIYRSVTDGLIDVIIGTHALIQDKISFRALGLIIIDEQHRFGVAQRAKLRDKGENVDLLIMTATPIPRSLSLTLYGDLDLSTIMEMPLGRIPIKTMSFPESKIKGVYNSVEKYISRGRQVFFVLPIIDESDKLEVKPAMNEYKNLKENIFPHRRIEILHGKLSSDEKNNIMLKFKEGQIDILVSTTIIEVGIDIPNANVMVIEHAERFGLSQLHQLRGRVGRDAHQSFCILIHPDKISAEGKRRIDTLESTNDGFKIAEEDLLMRGAGEITGTRQHGYNLEFEFTDISRDMDLILSARKEALDYAGKIENIEDTLNKLQSKNQYPNIVKGIRNKRILSILS